jgi:hypothetical protein
LGVLSRSTTAGAHLLADIEHRRLVALAFADHHRALYGERIERRAHGVDGRLVGHLLVAAAHQLGGGECRRLGDADRLERQIAVHFPRISHRFLRRRLNAPSKTLRS